MLWWRRGPTTTRSAIDDQVVYQLRTVVARTQPFDCTFRRCDWFGVDVLWLAQEPDEPFRVLTTAMTEAFPDYPPYGGAYTDLVPHLTIGEASRGTPARLRAAEADVASKLPVTARIREAVLVTGTAAPGSWRTVAALPLGAHLP